MRNRDRMNHVIHSEYAPITPDNRPGTIGSVVFAYALPSPNLAILTSKGALRLPDTAGELKRAGVATGYAEAFAGEPGLLRCCGPS